ncbi:hypothetical protein Za10_0347 [Zymomonas mobilis subsp. mobilis NCIMB 11163]|nr:hypothetical protein Za10_0347 [Zymomonas mobilis subsp. mobilis NCIMB 11163]
MDYAKNFLADIHHFYLKNLIDPKNTLKLLFPSHCLHFVG